MGRRTAVLLHNRPLHAHRAKAIPKLCFPIPLPFSLQQDPVPLAHIQWAHRTILNRLWHGFCIARLRRVAPEVEDADQIQRTVNDGVSVPFHVATPFGQVVDFVAVERQRAEAEERDGCLREVTLVLALGYPGQSRSVVNAKGALMLLQQR